MKNYTKKEIENGSVYYFNSENELHRIDGPAVEYLNGIRTWYLNGKFMFKYKHNKIALFSILEPCRV
jgi:hypothetical protein